MSLPWKNVNKSKTSKSNVSCAALGCHSIRRKNNDLFYHVFPKAGEKIQIVNELTGKLEFCEKLKLWESRVRMGKKATRYMKICSLHFKNEDYTCSGWSSKVSLRSTAVPSQNLPIPDNDKKDACKLAVEHTTRVVNRNPWNYLGLQNECMFVIDLIKQYTQLDTNSIFLTLQKIRLAHTFSKLGDDYGMSEQAATNTFLRSVSLIGQLMGEFIIWHPKEKIQSLLPSPFRADYGKVQCIINYFEIKIIKPKDAVAQSLTWSDYKKANTLKYLVSSTPDGVVNFISTGFGGKTSDAVVVEKSGFLDRLQPEAVIMLASQDFRIMERLFTKRQCTLLKLPRIDDDQNALVRIQATSVVNRLHEFNFLTKCSCGVTSQLTLYMDFITVIACGLINLQASII